MQLLETTWEHQSALAMFCRTGHYNPIKGVNEHNVSRYRELVYNLVDDTLQTAYPLTHYLLSPVEWNSLVDEFFSSHPCQSPQVWAMPKELWVYADKTGPFLAKKYPFLTELLLFEWLEVELFMMEDKLTMSNSEGDIRTGKLIINPEHHLQHFTYPVHLKNARYITRSDKGDYFLVMHRNKESGKVNFTSLSPFLARLLEMLAEEPCTVRDLIEKTSAEFKVSPDQQLENDFIQFLNNSIGSGLIAGFVKNNQPV